MKFNQIKQKYGTLYVYWDGTLSPEADALVEEAIALAEASSACMRGLRRERILLSPRRLALDPLPNHADERPVES
ncbi:hypothetical protein [Bradyrhizobium nanningense]|uniref:hypothetical protein n=1 Tax=Bradyrhizobium nanningense TaxID=1325118 RepID=UPI001008AD9C|nr:hypothetical protein [Bradyrhizobium nanningense]